MFGGELQYFRTDPATLPDRLALCREAAFSVIQTYVPWNVHEFSRGTLDFQGRTHPILPNDHHLDPFQFGDSVGTGGVNTYDLGLQVNTDLETFLGACRDSGFSVILRPGPFISDEWRNGGIPDWFLQGAPADTFEYGADGTPLLVSPPWSSPPAVAALLGGMSLYYFPSPSYASPYYLSAVQQWLQGFAAFVRPWLHSNGGPVVAVQVDDETCFYYHFGAFEVDYNPAMVARYTAVTGQPPPRAWPSPAQGIASLRPAFAWQRFKADQIGTFLGTLAGELRAAGVDVPITHEMELSLTPPADFAADAAAVLLAPELYPGADGPEAMPLIELTAQSARAAQRNRTNVWSAETQEGDMLLSSLLLGEGIIGSIQFNYQQGVPDDAVGVSGRLGQALRTAGRRLTECRRRADVAIVWDNDLAHAPVDSQQWGFVTDVNAVIEHHVPALATLLLRAGYAFDLLDTSAAAPEDYLDYRTILLASADILPRSAQVSLARYVRRGGHLVCWAQPPSLDEDLEPCAILAQACFGEPVATFYPEPAQEIDVLGHPVTTYLGVQTFSLSARAEAIASRAGAPCGYRRRVGQGEAVLLGSWPAAYNIASRSGAVLEEVPGSAAADPVTQLGQVATLAGKYFGPQAAAAVPAALTNGPAQTFIVYEYTNQRRSSTYVLAGGAIAYWNGDQVVGLVQITAASDGTPQVLNEIPYCPPDAAHVTAIRALVGAPPAIESVDPRIQARVLDAPDGQGATVVANNRWPVPVPLRLRTRVGARTVVLPSRGELTLPAETGIVLPVDYELPNQGRLLWATAQLQGVTAPNRLAVALALWAPDTAEIVLRLPGRLRVVTLDGAPIRPVRSDGRAVSVVVGAGSHTLEVRWNEPRHRARRHRRACARRWRSVR